MTTPGNPIQPFSPFLPSTYNFPQDEDRHKVFLTETFNQISDVVNDKKIGAYTQVAENQNGNKFFYDTTKRVRNGFQTLARIPSFPNSGTLTLTVKTMPQYPLTDVNPQFVVSHVWGSASKPCSAVNAGDGDYFSFMNQGDSRISFILSDTQIIITTTTDLSGYSGFIFIEYIRDGT
jgi:hypothetical protein